VEELAEQQRKRSVEKTKTGSLGDGGLEPPNKRSAGVTARLGEAEMLRTSAKEAFAR